MAWSLEERARRMPVRALDGGAVGPVDNGVGLPELVDVAGREPGRRGPQVVDGVVRGSLTEEPVADPNGTWRRRARRFDRTGPWPVRVTATS